MELLQDYFLTDNVLSVVLDDVVIVSEVADEDAGLATLGQHFCGSEVLLMENSVALWICLRVIDGSIVLSRLHVTILSVLEVVKQDSSLLTWLIVDILTSSLVLGSSSGTTFAVLWVTSSKISGKTWVVNYVLGLDAHNYVLGLDVHVCMGIRICLINSATSVCCRLTIWYLVLRILWLLVSIRFNIPIFSLWNLCLLIPGLTILFLARVLVSDLSIVGPTITMRK